MRHECILRFLLLGAVVLSGCAAPTAVPSPTPAAQPTVAASPALAAQPTAAPSPTPAAQLAAAATPTVVMATPVLLPPETPPAGATDEFRTDFSRHIVPYREILSGGPPRDGIPAIDAPRFVGVNEADGWLHNLDPVVFVQVGADARAYPVQILTWHEIVNDVVGSVPLAVTYCPLCNTAIAFERTFDGRVLDFGTTGRLRFSNLIMYDRQTETWWQQGTGLALAGEHAGRRLTFYPATIVSWQAFREAHPGGRVLSRDTGAQRRYGANPYVGYDNLNTRPFLYDGPATPEQLPQLARVIGVELNGEAVAYPYDELVRVHVVNAVLGGEPIVVFWAPGTASALDAPAIAEGRDVGAANAFSRRLGQRVLTFKFDGARFVDEQTGSAWNLFGQAVDGSLSGQALTPLVAVNHFWFSWAAFKPDTRVWKAR
ncbi:MAG: DUF3179 domain-containing protein [Anaerolineae bacterium]|nr:DUF3179 domain-containing protein [Anaerolineae bacterium]